MAISHSSSDLRVNRVKVLRMVLVLVGLLLICFVEKNSKKYSAALAHSCLPCSCDCVSDSGLTSLPAGEFLYSRFDTFVGLLAFISGILIYLHMNLMLSLSFCLALRYMPL